MRARIIKNRSLRERKRQNSRKTRLYSLQKKLQMLNRKHRKKRGRCNYWRLLLGRLRCQIALMVVVQSLVLHRRQAKLGWISIKEKTWKSSFLTITFCRQSQVLFYQVVLVKVALHQPVSNQCERLRLIIDAQVSPNWDWEWHKTLSSEIWQQRKTSHF